MFTTHCFIRKNTPELRKKLEELGLKPCYRMSKYPDEHKNIVVCKNYGGMYYGVSDEEATRPGNVVDTIKKGEMIDCVTNEDLFLAIAALRDDTDKNQWIIDEANECFGLGDSMMICDRNNMNDRNIYTHYRKATVEELIEHFKKGETNEKRT